MTKKKQKKEKVEDFRIEVSLMQSDVKTFIEKFKSDVGKKRKDYQLYAQTFRKKKTSV